MGIEAIDRLLKETRIDLREAGAMIAGDGRRPISPKAVKEWALRGRRIGATGPRVRLEYLRAGRELMTSREAVARYLAAVSV
jgi:hypothetical protein